MAPPSGGVITKDRRGHRRGRRSVERAPTRVPGQPSVRLRCYLGMRQSLNVSGQVAL
ncbi:DUF6207 family protein [Streptomyces hawaiiensis]|uniref:DUF6207 family protein n=1 Tax=Streptomyces hawaiiensis TaxID=67305 RepID=UPI00364C5CC1